jgi:hypothetical protein
MSFLVKVSSKFFYCPALYRDAFYAFQEKQIDQKAIETAFPDCQEINSSVITVRGKKIAELLFRQDWFLSAPQTTKAPIIKYKLSGFCPQVLIYQNIREGGFLSVQKVAVVAGPLMKEAPAPVFARLRLKFCWQQDPRKEEIMLMICRGIDLSRAFCKDGLKNVVPYYLHSLSTNKITIYSPLYKENLLDFLKRYPLGACTRAASKNLDKPTHLSCIQEI